MKNVLSNDMGWDELEAILERDSKPTTPLEKTVAEAGKLAEPITPFFDALSAMSTSLSLETLEKSMAAYHNASDVIERAKHMQAMTRRAIERHMNIHGKRELKIGDYSARLATRTSVDLDVDEFLRWLAKERMASAVPTAPITYTPAQLNALGEIVSCEQKFKSTKFRSLPTTLRAAVSPFITETQVGGAFTVTHSKE